jgi:hypothetical protein
MIEVADIFKKYAEAYRSKYKLPLQHLKVISAIEDCRTAKLGGHIEVCDKCSHIKISYNSCRNRHCPKCQSLSKERWLDARMKDLMPIQYFHVVFTIPIELNALTLQNKKLLYSILFRASSETLIELSRDYKHLGAEIGFISLLHTWGQNLMDHPHVHCIVTGGGLSLDSSKWISCRKDFFIHVKVLSRVFRGKFLDYLKKSYYSNKLNFSGQISTLGSRQEFKILIDELYKTEWVVYSKAPFKSPEHVLEYLGNYTHKVAISNSRITDLKDDKVTFKWRDYKDNNKPKLMTLDVFEFIRRFLFHVLPNGFVKIRHYGILSNRNRKTKLENCKKLLGVSTQNKLNSKAKETWQELLLRISQVDARICPCCRKGHMVLKETIFPHSGSPPNKKAIIA